MKRGEKISRKKYDKMYQAYLIHGNVTRVAKLCGLSATTVRKYKYRDNWNSKLEKTKEVALEQTAIDTGKLLSENLKILRGVKSYLVNQIKQLHESNLLEGDITKLVQVIRLESELSGVMKDVNPASSTINIINTIGSDGNLTDEKELKKRISLLYPGRSRVSDRF